MCPSRLKFVQEFERQLDCQPLRQWFEGARQREATLHDFPDPGSLRRFLHSEEESGDQKPEIWRVLVRSVQLDRTPEAVVFVLGLLEPALGRLAAGLEVTGLDADDLWQETVACALKALANPKLLTRRAPLVGLVKDTFQHLCYQLRYEFASAQKQAPLVDLPYEQDFESELESTDLEALLVQWGERARVDSAALELVQATRLDGKKLSQFAPARSPAYDRLRHARSVAERRLDMWLLRTASSGG